MRNRIIGFTVCFTFLTFVCAACSDDTSQPAPEDTATSADTSENDTVEADSNAPPVDSGSDTIVDTTTPPDVPEDTGPPPSEPTCETYCTTVQTHCDSTGETAQYTSQEACEAYCNDEAQLPIGTAEDTANNSVGCRTYHAETAANDEELALIHCPHAGPSGADICGTYCENYCHLAQLNCTGDQQLYADSSACMTACDAFSPDGKPGDTSGDSVQCRIYHLGVAGNTEMGGAETHCSHGAPDGGNVCVDEIEPALDCGYYCSLLDTNCTEDNSQFPTTQHCLDYCTTFGAYPLGTLDDVEGNTLGCRIYHAGAPAAGDPSTHCPHAGPSGGDACGSWCGNYCHLAGENCTGDNTLYSDNDDCLSQCLALSDQGAPGATSGDSVQCRIYHLGVAGDESSGGAATHCPHGALDGGGVCAPSPTCEEYCTSILSACTGDLAQYNSEQSCLTHCQEAAQWSVGTYADVSGNTIGCRQYHATVAMSDLESAAIHCPHAGPSGGNACGTWCENYCDLAMTNCAESDAIYSSAEECASACAGLIDSAPSGTAAQPTASGDSVQCRIYHLGVPASLDPAIHCPHGGLFGGAVCIEDSPTCDVYCAAVQNACGAEGSANSQYENLEDCQSYCAGTGQLAAGSDGVTTGNTVGCRLYHARVAQTTDPDVHCAHAGGSGGDVCGSWCTNYCYLAETNCVDSNALYSSSDDCLGACLGFNADGNPGDKTGDSVQCRIYHLGAAGNEAAGGPETHCPHGSTDGGGVCAGEVVCTPNCGTGPSAKECGTNGCGGTCGECGENTNCDDGVCVSTCAPSCAGKECGSDGCGGECGDGCLESQDCTPGGACVDACVPNCSESKVCGDDGCGGDCGACVSGNCIKGTCVEAPPPPPPYETVWSVFQQYCGGCHTAGSSGGASLGNSDIDKAYADSQKIAYSVTGTKGQATLARIQSGTMPPGAGCTGNPASDANNSACLTQADQDAIQAWLDGGQAGPD